MHTSGPFLGKGVVHWKDHNSVHTGNLPMRGRLFVNSPILDDICCCLESPWLARNSIRVNTCIYRCLVRAIMQMLGRRHHSSIWTLQLFQALISLLRAVASWFAYLSSPLFVPLPARRTISIDNWQFVSICWELFQSSLFSVCPIERRWHCQRVHVEVHCFLGEPFPSLIDRSFCDSPLFAFIGHAISRGSVVVVVVLL